MSIAVIVVHVRALRDGHCGPTSAKGAGYAPHNDGEINSDTGILVVFNTFNAAIITNEYDDRKYVLNEIRPYLT